MISASQRSSSSSTASTKPIRGMDDTPHTSPHTRALDDLFSPTTSSLLREDDMNEISLDEDSSRFSTVTLGTPPLNGSTPNRKPSLATPLKLLRSPIVSTVYNPTDASSPGLSPKAIKPLSINPRKLSVAPVTPGPTTGTPEAPTPANVPFLLARLDAQKEMLESDPISHRLSLDGSSKLREDFQRLQEEQEKAALAAEKRAQDDEDAAQAIDWDFWGAVMADYDYIARTQSKTLALAIEKGVPPALRGMIWQLMSVSKDLTLEQAYAAHLKQPCPHEKAIQRDINRTFPNHAFFVDGHIGQENLYNVLKAYSLYDPEVGYCQGLAFIVAALLLNMPDEEAFCVLVRLMYSYGLRSMFLPEMPGLQLRLFQFDRLVEELLPVLFLHFTRQGVKSSMYCSQWFLTMFSYRFPLDMVFRIFDCVLANGIEAIFGFSIILLQKNEEELLKLKFDHILEYLKSALFNTYRTDDLSQGNLEPISAGVLTPSTSGLSSSSNSSVDPTIQINGTGFTDPSRQSRSVTALRSKDSGPRPVYNVDQFVQDAFQVKVTPFMLDSYATEWEDLRRAQNAHAVEMENLRNANKALSAQVKRLEESLTHLEVDHCELVKELVTTKVERDEMEGELVKYKILYAELMHQSEDAQLTNRMSRLSSISSTRSRVSS